MDDDDQIICPRCHRGSVRRLAKKTAMRDDYECFACRPHYNVSASDRLAIERAMPLVFIRRMQKTGFTCDRTRAPTYPDARMPAGAEDRADRRLATDRRGGALARQPAPPSESLLAQLAQLAGDFANFA